MCTIYTIYRAWQCTTLKQVEPKREAFNDPSAEEALAQYILYILVIEYQMPTSSWRSTQKTQKKKKLYFKSFCRTSQITRVVGRVTVPSIFPETAHILNPQGVQLSLTSPMRDSAARICPI